MLSKILGIFSILSLLNLLFSIVSSTDTTTASRIIRSSDCPRNWTRYDRTKSCFFVIEQRLRWAEAERQCARHGGHLASIVDEYENFFVFDVAKKANLSIQTVWLGKVVKLTKTGAYEWNDGAVGRFSEGFRGEPPSGNDICLTMWLDFDRPDGSWNEWDCSYATGYSGICKKSFRRAGQTTQSAQTATPTPSTTHVAKRCCVSSGCNGYRCLASERCIPDDLNCWTKSCSTSGPGWCLPAI